MEIIPVAGALGAEIRGVDPRDLDDRFDAVREALLLHMDVCPEVGGDTLWCSAIAAYDTLSPAMQEFVCDLTVTNDNTGFIRRMIDKLGDPDQAVGTAFAA